MAMGGVRLKHAGTATLLWLQEGERVGGLSLFFFFQGRGPLFCGVSGEEKSKKMGMSVAAA